MMVRTQRVNGTRAGIAAACAFLFPSTVLMMICGAAYSLFRCANSLTVFFDGMNAAMVGIVAAVTVDLARSALHSKVDLLIAAICALALSFRIVSEPALACAGRFGSSWAGGWYTFSPCVCTDEGAHKPTPTTNLNLSLPP